MPRQLTRNFNESEFLGNPPLRVRQNKLPQVAALCQWLRELAGVPARVTSYYRSDARQRVVNPQVSDSQHEKGEAADLQFNGITQLELARRIGAAVKAGKSPPFGQIIFYPDYPGTTVHISLRGVKHLRSVMVAPRRAEGGRHYVMLNTPQRVALLSTVPRVGAASIIVVATLAVVALTFLSAVKV